MNPKEELMRRLLEKVVIEGACWIWQGYRTKAGYGELSVKGSKVLAHRLSFELFMGPIIGPLDICHRCDTPACVNPDHLFAGSHEDNMRDMIEKGRAGFQRADFVPHRVKVKQEIEETAKVIGPMGFREGVRP